MDIDNSDGDILSGSQVALKEPQEAVLEKVQQQLDLTVQSLEAAYEKANILERRLKQSISVINQQKLQIDILTEKLKNSEQRDQSLKETSDKINTLEGHLKAAVEIVHQQKIQSEIQKEKLKQQARLDQSLKEASDKINVLENHLKQTAFTINQQAIQLELLKEKVINFNSRELERKKEIEQNKKLHKFRALLTSLLYLLSSVLLGFGINLQTSTPPDTLGTTLIVLAIAIQFIISILVIFIQGEKN